jgi:threonine aldolase
MLVSLVEEASDPTDVYGAGGAIEGLEREVAGLLGKPAAVFVPSGTMAQQVALRIAADARSCRTVAYHPTCHVEVHEQRGYAHVHGLRARLVGPRHRPPLRADLDDVTEPLAALLLELPQREIGGVLPPWDDVLAQAAWARERGTALHLDGARLWETTPHYGLTLAEIAGPFDTVYVSFYKTLGGIAGAALAGDAATIAHARVWIRRLGGNLVAMYPMVLSARRGLRERLPRIPGYVARARRVAEQLVAAGVRVNPDPPHVNMLHAFFPADPDRLLDASAAIALERKVTLVMGASPTDVPGTCRTEIVLGDAADAIPDAELGELLAELVARAAG